MTASEDTAPPCDPAPGLSPSMSAPHAEQPDQRARGGCLRRTVLAALGTAIVLALLSISAWASAAAPVQVPGVVGLPENTATDAVLRAGLVKGSVQLTARPGFGVGTVVAQAPDFPQSVHRGTPVDLSVAVAPSPVVVPDLTLLDQSTAENSLTSDLLQPIVCAQLSDSVSFGRVVSQLPRPGQSALTGSEVVMLVSMGGGTSGAMVPSVVGKKASAAAAALESAYLVPRWFGGVGSADPSATIIDQVPDPGSVAPIGSPVTLVVATPTDGR